MSSGAVFRLIPLTLGTLPVLATSAAVAQEAAAPVQGVAAESGAKVSLAPLRIEMDGPEIAATMRVHNPSQIEAIGIQMRAFDWSQSSDGSDIYEPADDVRITPSIITIEPGKTQVFRIIRREGPAGTERRYRIAIDQLPDPKAKNTSISETRIRFTVPMFVDRVTSTPASLAWSIAGNVLRVANSGQQTPRMVNLALTDVSGREIEIDGVSLHYIMGGSTLNWALPRGCPAGPVRLTATVDGEAVDAQVQPSC